MSEEGLRREVFSLGYHLHWSYEEIMQLDVASRREFLRLLVEAIDQQNESMAKAGRR